MPVSQQANEPICQSTHLSFNQPVNEPIILLVSNSAKPVLLKYYLQGPSNGKKKYPPTNKIIIYKNYISKSVPQSIY